MDNGISNIPTIFSCYCCNTGFEPYKVTVPTHGLSTGAIVEFDSIVGLTAVGAQPTLSLLNGQQYQITVIDVNNFTLQGHSIRR